MIALGEEVSHTCGITEQMRIEDEIHNYRQLIIIHLLVLHLSRQSSLPYAYMYVGMCMCGSIHSQSSIISYHLLMPYPKAYSHTYQSKPA